MVIPSATYERPQPLDQTIKPDVVASNRAVSNAIRLLNDSGAAGDSHQFSVAIDPATKEAVVRIVDRTTNELVEQIPSEYILRVAQQISESLSQQSGALVDKTL